MANSQQQSKGPMDAEIFGYAIKKSSTTRHRSTTNAEDKTIILDQAQHKAIADAQGHNAIKQGTTHIKNALNTANAWEGSKCKSIPLRSGN